MSRDPLGLGAVLAIVFGLGTAVSAGLAVSEAARIKRIQESVWRFPKRCPKCGSTSLEVLPSIPEVVAYHCKSCCYTWTEPVDLKPPTVPPPEKIPAPIPVPPTPTPPPQPIPVPPERAPSVPPELPIIVVPPGAPTPPPVTIMRYSRRLI